VPRKPTAIKSPSTDKNALTTKKPNAGKRADDDMVKADREVWGDPKPVSDKPAWAKKPGKADWAGKPKGKFSGAGNGAPKKRKPGKPKG